MLEYTAIDGAGTAVRGKLIAENEIALDRELEQRGLVLREAHPVDVRAHGRARAMKTDQLIAFTTQLATVLSSGLPLLQGLAGIGKRLESAASRALVEELVTELEAGSRFSEVLDRRPGTFPTIYRASVRAGELTGALDVVLLRLAKHLEWSRSVQGSIVQALIYPGVICLAILGLIVILLTFVLPRIVELFPGGRESLPMATRAVLWTSDFLRQNAIPLAGLVLVAAVAAVWFVRTPQGRFVLHALLLRLPRVGKLLAKIATSRFASTAAVLHGAGCNVLVTLDTAADTCGNAVLERGFRGASDAVRRGSTVGEALEGRDEVDPLLKQLVSVGERSGKLDECLGRLVAHYDEEIPRAVKSTLAIVEPALLVGAGLVVGFIVFAAITPIFKMYENI